ncbi:MAG TPA: hypothetical protein VGO57_16455 [Verrucomicrobiae bacterium]
MKKTLIALLGLCAVCVSLNAQTNTPTPVEISGTQVETIIAIRHGEKPKGGLGQLTNRGLNRSLALPEVLLGKYGTPQFIFAPNPTEKSDGNKYYYVRPLATIEPTAIRCGLPVNTKFGYTEIKALETELEKPEYHQATVFIAWEHGLLDEFGKNMVKDNGGDVKNVPEWPGKEYDMIFVFKITRPAGQKTFSFTVDHEGLNNLSDEYPTPVKK